MDLVFRRAHRADVPDIVRLLRHDALGEQREQEDGPVAEAYWLAFGEITADDRQLLIVAEREGEVVGTLQASFIPYLTYQGGERAQIEAVRVAPSARGHGIGRQMIEWAIEQARARSCHLVQLTTDKQRPDALRFYESVGFTASHEGMKLHL